MIPDLPPPPPMTDTERLFAREAESAGSSQMISKELLDAATAPERVTADAIRSITYEVQRNVAERVPITLTAKEGTYLDFPVLELRATSFDVFAAYRALAKAYDDLVEKTAPDPRPFYDRYIPFHDRFPALPPTTEDPE